MIDPSFGQALLNNSTIIEEYKQAKGKDEVVPYSRLEVLEGKLGAKELEPKLQKCTDKYGRPAYVYSRDLAEEVTRKGQKAQLKTEMKLEAGQAKRIHDSWSSITVGTLKGGKGSAGSKRTPAAPKEMTEEQKATSANQKKVRSCINMLTSKIKDCSRVMLQVKGSKHVVAKAVLGNLKEKEKEMAESLKAVQKADVEGVYKASAMKLVSYADAIMLRVTVDLKLAKSISK